MLGLLREMVEASTFKGSPINGAIMEKRGPLLKRWIGSRGSVTHTGTRKGFASKKKDAIHLKVLITKPCNV